MRPPPEQGIFLTLRHDRGSMFFPQWDLHHLDFSATTLRREVSSTDTPPRYSGSLGASAASVPLFPRDPGFTPIPQQV
jgi:hypothetical protein